MDNIPLLTLWLIGLFGLIGTVLVAVVRLLEREG